jgi:hypothetical protein
MQILADEVICDSHAAADGCLPVSGRIPGKSDARFRMTIIVIQPGTADETGIARIAESGRSIFNDGALRSRIKTCQAEIGQV